MATVEMPTGVQTAMAPDWGRLIMTLSSCIYWALTVIRFSAKSPLSLTSCLPLTLGADVSSGCMAVYNKTPQTGWLKQQKSIFLESIFLAEINVLRVLVSSEVFHSGL